MQQPHEDKEVSIMFANDFSNRIFFRWAFEFIDKSARRGVWNNESNNFCDLASSVNKTGMVRALIEGKHFNTREVKVYADMIGEDFINFQTLMIVRANDVSMNQRAYGMQIVGRYKTISCYETGLINIEDKVFSDADRYPDWTKI